MPVKDQHMLLNVFWSKGIGSDSKQLKALETEWLKTISVTPNSSGDISSISGGSGEIPTFTVNQVILALDQVQR
jgi:hypothetical protein